MEVVDGAKWPEAKRPGKRGSVEEPPSTETTPIPFGGWSFRIPFESSSSVVMAAGLVIFHLDAPKQRQPYPAEISQVEPLCVNVHTTLGTGMDVFCDMKLMADASHECT